MPQVSEQKAIVNVATTDEIIAIAMFTALNLAVFLGVGWGQLKLPVIFALAASAISWTSWFIFGRQNWMVPAGFFATLSVFLVLQIHRHRHRHRHRQSAGRFR